MSGKQFVNCNYGYESGVGAIHELPIRFRHALLTPSKARTKEERKDTEYAERKLY